MKGALRFLLLLSLCYLTGCAAEDQAHTEKTEAATEEKKQKAAVIEGKVPETLREEEMILEKEEVAEMTKTILHLFYDSMVSLGVEYNWNSENPADFNVVKEEIQPYVTKGFLETVKGSLGDIYCQCDAFSVPHFDPEVRFEFEQVEDNKIEIQVLDPGSEMITMGYESNIELLKEDNEWKLNKLSSRSLEGSDLKLTKEEAEKLLSSEQDTITFIEEFNSPQGAGKAYLFNLKTPEWEELVAISSKDASRVFDYDYEPEAIESSVEGSLSNDAQTLIDHEMEQLGYGSLEDVEIIDFHGDGFPEILAIHHTPEIDTILIHEYDQGSQQWNIAYKEISQEKIDAFDTLLIFETMNLLEDDSKQQVVIGKQMGSSAFIGFIVLSEYNGGIEKVFSQWDGDYPSGEVIQEGKDLVVLSYGNEVDRFSQDSFTEN
ncbi:hypothetical protein [Rossellomorea sp. FM04394]|uniref:hypothetical protein n=1 Tax=Rossellomorea sp. FM04394 TaxID=3243076 RepID=UPI0035A6D95D